jgi:hypothetical protein
MNEHKLDASPSLTQMYVKAALTGVLHRGAELPDSVYTLADRPIEADHLAAYQQVCGFPVSDVLPPTYLHVLAFPLSVALMTESDFPFPLVGMVHVANAITVARPVRSAEAVAFRVWAGDLREHPAGRQFELFAEATIAGEPVWSGRSSYLRREKQPERNRAERRRSENSPPDGTAAQIRVPGDIGRKYAAVSGDWNPIHLHPLAARLFGFPSAIAHGMWVKARTLASLEGRLPEAFTAEVAFKLPVRLPSTLAAAAVREGEWWQLDVRNVDSGKPHLSGSVLPA